MNSFRSIFNEFFLRSFPPRTLYLCNLSKYVKKKKKKYDFIRAFVQFYAHEQVNILNGRSWV